VLSVLSGEDNHKTSRYILFYTEAHLSRSTNFIDVPLVEKPTELRLSMKFNKEHQQEVHHQIAKAQRGRKSITEPKSRRTEFSTFTTEVTNTVQPVGYAYHGDGSSASLFQTRHKIQSSNRPLVMPATTGPGAGPCMATPTIQLPGRGPQQLPVPAASTSSAVHSVSGYTANHLSYNMTRQSLASNAYALHGGHVIVIEVRAVHMPIGKTKAQLIGVSLKSKKKNHS
jgi:hypothetical protein